MDHVGHGQFTDGSDGPWVTWVMSHFTVGSDGSWSRGSWVS